jgi:hypothetical protein
MSLQDVKYGMNVSHLLACNLGRNSRLAPHTHRRPKRNEENSMCASEPPSVQSPSNGYGYSSLVSCIIACPKIHEEACLVKEITTTELVISFLEITNDLHAV